jgi:hypothetical protein
VADQPPIKELSRAIEESERTSVESEHKNGRGNFLQQTEITREVYLHSIPADAHAAVQKVEDLLIRPKLTQVAENWEKGSSLIQ